MNEPPFKLNPFQRPMFDAAMRAAQHVLEPIILKATGRVVKWRCKKCGFIMRTLRESQGCPAVHIKHKWRSAGLACQLGSSRCDGHCQCWCRK